MVVVPEVQWSEYENWLELRAEMQAKATRTSHTQSSEHAAADTAISRNVPSSKSATTSLAENELNELFLPSMTTNNSMTASTKRTHQRAESSSGLSGASSPPRKKNIPPAALCSPDRDRLKEVLKIAGSANLNVKKVFGLQNENIQFHHIPTRAITDLLQNAQYHSFSVDTAESSIGQLTIDTSTEGFIGIGGFKTAHAGWLTLTASPRTGLGSVPRHKVVVKRPFYKVFPTAVTAGPYKVGRFALADELPKLFREANVLYWSKSLLQLTYDFIDRSMNFHRIFTRTPAIRGPTCSICGSRPCIVLQSGW